MDKGWKPCSVKRSPGVGLFVGTFVEREIGLPLQNLLSTAVIRIKSSLGEPHNFYGDRLEALEACPARGMASLMSRMGMFWRMG